MLIIGASGFAKQLLDSISENEIYCKDEFVFFDNLNEHPKSLLFNKFRILKSFDEAENYFKSKNNFLIGIGGTIIRDIPLCASEDDFISITKYVDTIDIINSPIQLAIISVKLF